MSALHAPARVPYTLADGTVVPSVTTIIGRFKESGGLIWWAWNEGKEGRDYRDTKQKAADAGTLAHLMVEADIRGKTPPAVSAWPYEIYTRALRAFDNYISWKQQTNLTPVETEVRLVSEKYRFGGTLDSMLIGGSLSLGDWKTSNSVYQDYLLQLAAYGILWEENRVMEPILGGFHLIRFAKDNPDFAHYHYGELETARKLFLVYRQAYDLDRELKKRVK